MAKKIDLKALKARLDLKTVLEARGVKLQRQGSSYVARCPFHADRTPSFSVKAGSQRWKCFGCGAAGDVFGFVQKQDGIGLPEAVRRLVPADAAPVTAPGPARARRSAAAPATTTPIPAPVATLAPEPESTQHPPAIDRPGQEVLDRLVAHWHETLARTPRASAYLRRRGLWHPEILRTFRVGYASGRLPHVLPADGKIRRQLEEMGVLNDRGNEFLYRRVVVPIVDDAGVLVNVYGRAIDSGATVPHLYLPGPRRGVFNAIGIQATSDLILTESVLDALSVIVLGFPNTTASYGVEGFTADHRAALLRAKIQRVYCAYDADPAGDRAAEQLALDLAGHDIEVLRVVLPDVKDPNDFLVGGGTREAFQALLDQAQAIPVPRPGTLTPAPDVPADLTAAPGTTSATPAACTVTLGERTYEVATLPRPDTLSLRVRLKARHQTKTFLNTLNLYADHARATTVKGLLHLFAGTATKEQIEEDLFSIIEELERRQRDGDHGTAAAAADAMSPEDRQMALTYLCSPDLAAKIRADLGELGVVGEERVKLLVYLVATSRKLARPLSLVVVSRSSAGKSFVVTRTCELMPPEELLAYTRLSAKALFHDEAERLKHKLLVIEEAQGMEEAAYALRVMQSAQMLRNLSTITDPATGRHRACENVVYGPVALIVTTTTELDFETVSRAFVISVDESVEQTKAIHAMQRAARTLAGLDYELDREAILSVHRNAQRLLTPMRVANPYAPRLSFPTATLRLRREHEKYLTLIEAITFLFQYQRQRGVRRRNGVEIPYVVTARADIDLANELVVASLKQAFEELTVPSRELLSLIRRMVEARAADGTPTEVKFFRREVREFTRWSDYQVRIHLKQLEELEYVQAVTGSFGKQYVYRLSPDHHLALDRGSSLADEIRELGLVSAADLDGEGEDSAK
jgi:hypothetical protein